MGQGFRTSIADQKERFKGFKSLQTQLRFAQKRLSNMRVERTANLARLVEYRLRQHLSCGAKSEAGSQRWRPEQWWGARSGRLSQTALWGELQATHDTWVQATAVAIILKR